MLKKTTAGIGLFTALGLALFVGCGGAGTSTIDSTGGDGGGGGGSGGTGATSGGVNPADAGPGGTTTQLSCGNTSCAIPAQVCCITPTSAGLAYGCETGTCALPDAGQGNGGDGGQGGNQGGGDVNLVMLSCSDQANCPTGTVCCATRSDATGTVAACQMGTSCQKDGIQLCDPAAPAATNGCPSGQQCISDNIQDLGLPASFGRCKKN